ncbi:hypothetical protein PISMIDRAFT_16893 [Pisolithus microcarpus 441]|uniref:Unplaced genomic scaffold scaffold_230, whole genome shotgun sequence n=1 Tax=Pisolithus microcarpus 441 TaxID=765257 RepID=A0A0C9YEC1_9AGAM|nr:hypothetical protein PISMIDRAFT_16893 [Pisolithus microcarpus 441]
MDTDPLEPYLPIIAVLASVVGQACIKYVTENMPPDKDCAHWTEEEKEALISFLTEQEISGKMGDGSFKPAIWNAATDHLAEKFPNQKGPMKTAEMCKGKLKTVLRDINLWCAHSGKHWDNVNGANIATEDKEKDYQEWIGSRPRNSICLFKTSRWSLLEGMEVLFLNNQACGMHAYHPTTTAATTAATVAFATNVPGHSLFMHASSNTSSNPVVTLPPSTIPLHFTAPQIEGSSSVITGDMTDELPINKEVLPTQPLMFLPWQFPSNFTAPTPPTPMTYPNFYAPSTTSSMQGGRKHAYAVTNISIPMGGSQFPSAQAALQLLPFKANTDHSLKKAKKNKEQSMPSVLVGVQGSLSYLGSIISSSSAVTAQEQHSKQMHTTMELLKEQDADLPVEVQSALMEAFQMDPGTIDPYIMSHDKHLHRNWIQTCLCNMQLVPCDFTL